VQSVRSNPGRLADLALLIGDAVSPPEALDRATQTADAPPCRTRAVLAHARVVASRCPTVVALHAWRLRRLLDHAARDMARRIGGGVVYHESNLIARPFDGATVVMMHDLSWRADPALHPPERVAWIERRLPATLRQATRFVSVSDFTARVMVATLGIDRARIDVVSPGVSPMFWPMEAGQAAPVLARHGLADRSYILAVSTIEPRKNFDRLLAAHLRLPPALRRRAPLVIAGGKGWGDVLARPEAEAAIRDGTVLLLGHVADADLVTLCARAAVFAYVRLYEGFGLPVVEAMATGCPVLASSTTAVGEIAAGAALMVDPMDEGVIAEGLRCLMEDDALAERLRLAGLARAAEFTWDRTLATLLGSWRKALD
jgi:glycosyltransferase involved in cell wall biosynthesis